MAAKKITCIVVALFLIIVSPLALAQTWPNPGHPAWQIGGGAAFNNSYGNFLFPAAVNLTADSPTFHVDATGDRVGIGTASPQVLLNVRGAANTAIFELEESTSGNDWDWQVQSDGDLIMSESGVANRVAYQASTGNVGMGTAGPVAPLDIFRSSAVNGPMISIRSDFTAAGKYAMIRFGDQSQTTLYQKGAIIYEGVAGSARGRFHIALENTDGSGTVALTDARVTVQSDGKVGIGTTAPNQTLHVNGSLAIREDYIIGSGTGYGCIGCAAGSTIKLYNSGTGDLELQSGTAYDVVLQASGGKVGIGTATPSATLQVSGTINATGDICTESGNKCLSSAGAGSGSGNVNGTGAANKIAFWTGTNNISSNNLLHWDNTNLRLGINQTSPGNSISFSDVNGADIGSPGLTWYSPTPTLYGIYKSAGAWTAPYQQLTLAWATGIVLNPKTDGVSYGKTYVEIKGDGLNVSSGNLVVDGATFNVNASGDRVGVGTASPQSAFHVLKSSSGDDFLIRATSTSGSGADPGILLGRESTDGAAIKIVTGTNDYLSFAVSGSDLPAFAATPQMILRDDGKVGIGTTAPGQNLDVVGDVNFTGGDIYGANGIGLDLGEVGDALYIMDYGNPSYTDIYCSNGTLAQYCEFRSGVYISSGATIAESALYARGGILNDQAEDTYFESAQGISFNLDRDNNNADTEYFTFRKNGAGAGAGTEIMRLNATGTLNVTQDVCISGGSCLSSAGGAETDTLATVTARGNTTTQPVTIDSDSNELTNIANDLYVNGTTDNVGVGTATPTYKIETVTSGTGALRLQSSTSTVGSPVIDMWDNGRSVETVISSYDGATAGTYIASYSSHPLMFSTAAGQAKMTIDTAGKVGIGTKVPYTPLQVNGNITTTWGDFDVATYYLDGSTYKNGFNVVANNRQTNLFSYSGDGSGYITFSTGTVAAPSEKMRINYAGNVGIGDPAPNAKLEVNAGNYNIAGLNVTYDIHAAGLGVDGSATYWGIGLFQDGVKRFVVDSNGGGLIGASYMDSDAPANGLAVQGKVGIGTLLPNATLHVVGTINATGDICTESGNKCLSTVGGGTIDGTGSAGQVATWTDTDTLTYDSDFDDRINYSSARSQSQISGGGTITWNSATSNLTWSSRFIWIPVAKTVASAGGYYELSPSWAALPAWTGLYARCDAAVGCSAEIRTYTDGIEDMDNWFLVAYRNSDTSTIVFADGTKMSAAVTNTITGGIGAVSGSGTAGRIPKFNTGGTTLTDSGISDSSDAVAITINSAEETNLTGDLVVTGTDINMVRGDTSAIRRVGIISFDWTSNGQYDTSSYNGIETKSEAGNFADAVRINSYSDLTFTIDSNGNSVSSFIVQKESTADGTNLFRVNESGHAWFGTGGMYWDNTLGRLGIGTTSPNATLDVIGTINATGDICYEGGNKCLSALGTGSMSNWILGADSGTNQQVDNAEIVNISGSGGITTSAGATNKVTVGINWASVSGDAIPESKIDIDTACASPGALYQSGNDLACRSNVVDGTGSGSRAAFWTDADTISYDHNFTWDNTNKLLGLGTTAPLSKLHIENQSNLGTSDVFTGLRLAHYTWNDAAFPATAGSRIAFDFVWSGATRQTVGAIEGHHASGWGGGLLFLTAPTGASTNPPAARMSIDQYGRVGLNNTGASGADTTLHVTGGVCIDSDTNCADPGLGNLDVAGNMTVDGTTLTVNSSSHRVGIGTSSPSRLLQVNGDALANNYYVTAGNGYGVGFWNAAPTSYGIFMSVTASYLYGDVTDYAITNVMTGGTARGFTWSYGTSPSMSLNANDGNLTIKGVLKSNGTGVSYHLGNVGVGTVAPANADSWARVLDVYGVGHSKIIATTNGGIETGVYAHDSGIWGAGKGGLFGTRSNNNISFITNSAAKMTILTGGNVGIGTITPNATLHVVGTINATGDICTATGNKCLSTAGTGTVTGTGTQHYVAVWSGSGSLTADTTVNEVFLYNYTSHRLGMGTLYPEAKLHIIPNSGSAAILGNYGSATGNSAVSLAGGSAIGHYSIAGNSGTSKGDNSAAFNSGFANGTQSFAINYNTNASGEYSFAQGRDTNSSGSYSAAMNYMTKSNGSMSFAIGRETRAGGAQSFASGYQSYADGMTAAAFGTQTSAKGASAMAIGTLIEVSGANSVGIGLTSSTARYLTQSNTMAIMDGNVGIDTVTPDQRLKVAGNANITGTIYASGGINATNKNVTNVDCITFTSGGKICTGT